MRYVLLLRGINVGGKNKVSMSDLKTKIAELGYDNIVTYINSGNVLFDTTSKRADVENRVSEMLRSYPFSIQHVLWTSEEYLAEVEQLPAWWNEQLARRDVLFATAAVDYDEMKAHIQAMPLHDEVVHFGNKAVFWGMYTEQEYLRTSYHKQLLKAPFYSLITIRNGKTFDKLTSLLQS